MSKLLSITMSVDFNGLKAQEIDFTESGEIVEIKGVVGSGKTTAQKAPELALSGGNKTLFDDSRAFGQFDNEVCIMSKERLFMRTYTDQSGAWKSIVYQKDEAGKISKDPIINGRKMTPAVARDTFQTEMTFGAGRFISKDPKEHFQFMMDTYSDKLKAMGVIFDKQAPNYQGSILWRLEQAKMERTNREWKKKELNAFKTHLEAEGYDEQNIPASVDISALKQKLETIENNRRLAESAYQEAKFAAKQTELNRIQSEIDKLTAKGNEFMAKITAYNANLQGQDELRKANLKAEIDEHNRKVTDQNIKTNKANSAKDELSGLGCLPTIITDIENWIALLPKSKIREYSELENLEPLSIVPISDGKVTDFTPKYTTEVNQALTDLSELRKQIAPLFAAKQNQVFEYPEFDPKPYDTTEIAAKIESGKISNKISERWAAFFDHQQADENVKSIWKEYCEMFTRIDLGVSGLKMAIVGDEDKSEIRTTYNGEYDPELFKNTEKEDRLLNTYSETQKPVIAILMQKYLLDEKTKKGDDGLRAIFVEMPMDKLTRLVLKRMKNEFDIDIFTSTTGDFKVSDLEPGQFLIENGYLLNNISK